MQKRKTGTKKRSGSAKTQNVFVELGFGEEEAANLILRSQLMLVLKDTIKERGWTQQRAAKELCIHQPRVSDLLKGRLSEFSLDTLVCLAEKLGFEIELSLKRQDVA